MPKLKTAVAAAAAFLMLFGSACAADSTGHVSPKAATPVPEAYEDAKALINQAVARAEREGKQKVVVKLGEDPALVQGGDLVRVRYVLNVAEIADSKDALSSLQGVPPLDEPVLEDVVAGHPATVPGIGTAVLDMTRGASKSVTLAPEKAYGLRDPDKVNTFPSVHRMPMTLTVSSKAFYEKTKRQPVVGEMLSITPYFKSVVVSVKDDQTVIRHLPTDGQRVPGPFGDTVIRVADDEVEIRLLPRKGTVFTRGRQQGIISQVGDADFTVDFNHPFSGKTISFDLEVLSYTKESRLAEKEVPWVEALDAGYALAAEHRRPMVIILYASWCRWCEKLLTETMTDVRVKQYADDFVWVKVDSDKDKAIMSRYGQKSFPMVLLMTDDGTEIFKKEGFMNARDLSHHLERTVGRGGEDG